MDHLNSDTKKQYLRDDIRSNKNSLKMFHQIIRSLRNKKVNLEILLNTNLLNIDVLGFTEHWLIDDEISCYNLPNFSLVSKYCRHNKRYGGSCIYVRAYILAKPITNFKHLNLDEHFKVSIVKLVHFKILFVYIGTLRAITKLCLIVSEIILDYIDKMKDQVIIIGDLNISSLKKIQIRKK
jgi:hypothetical protein